MDAQSNNDGWIDGKLFNENVNKLPFEAFLLYAGQWIAFNADGTRIVAHHEDMLTLSKMVLAAGYKSTEVVFESVPVDFDQSILG